MAILKQLDLDIEPLRIVAMFMLLVDIMHICMLFSKTQFWVEVKRLRDTEIWALDGDIINKKSTEPTLSYYANYPELFVVDPRFCVWKI